MPNKELPDPRRLANELEYDPERGLFRWKKIRGTRRPGWFKGTAVSNGSGRTSYTIPLGGRRVAASRAAWALSKGFWPERPVLHINGDTEDLRLANLTIDYREAPRKGVLPSTGVIGVYRIGPKFQSRITHDGRIHVVGTFSTVEEGADAYDRVIRLVQAGAPVKGAVLQVREEIAIERARRAS